MQNFHKMHSPLSTLKLEHILPIHIFCVPVRISAPTHLCSCARTVACCVAIQQRLDGHAVPRGQSGGSSPLLLLLLLHPVLGVVLRPTKMLLLAPVIQLRPPASIPRIPRIPRIAPLLPP